MAALAAKYALAYAENEWPAGVPFPDAPLSWFLGLPRSRNMISGLYRGVYVVAFDFNVNVGRTRQLGSGVGIKGKVSPQRLPTLGKLDFQWAEPWSFLSTRLRLFGWSRRLRAEELVNIWDVMIDRAEFSIESRRNPLQVLGGLHIRPRRRSQQ